MKKILSLIFLSLLTLALVACGGKKEEATKGKVKSDKKIQDKIFFMTSSCFPLIFSFFLKSIIQNI